MHNRNLAYVNTRNQTSFEEDPFDLGLGFSQGMTTMCHARALELYAEELVSQHATYECEEYRLDLENLPEDKQSELTRLFLESIDREFESEAIHGNDFSIENDYTCALLAMLKDDNKETRERLAEVTRKNIIIWYEKSLQKILNDACESYLYYTNQAAGLRCYQDEEHGDFVWSKA
jgi:hypothetical protein